MLTFTLHHVNDRLIGRTRQTDQEVFRLHIPVQYHTAVLSMRSQIWEVVPIRTKVLNSSQLSHILPQGPKFLKKSAASTLCFNVHIFWQCSVENLSKEYIASFRIIRILVSFVCSGHFQEAWKKIVFSIVTLEQKIFSKTY